MQSAECGMRTFHRPRRGDERPHEAVRSEAIPRMEESTASADRHGVAGLSLDIRVRSPPP